MKVSELISKDEYECAVNVSNKEIKRVTSNVNLIEKDTLFVLLKGINFDTEKIIEYILAKKPAVIVCDKDRTVKTDIPVLKVENARLALAYICSKFYKIDYSALKFIGVTGTNGKTTTATMINTIFKKSGIKTGFIGTGKILIGEREANEKNYSMTTPDPETLYPMIKRMQNEGCDVIIMEVSSHALALDKVAPIRFECSVFTNLSEEHMDFHTTIEDYYKTKIKLFYQSEHGVFNSDDEYSARAMREVREMCKTHSIGVLWDADTMARDVILMGLEGSSYIYRERDLIFKVKLCLAGNYNIYNSLLAIKCALILKISPRIIKEALFDIKKIDGRLEIIDDKITVIIDYAHTTTAFENLLKTINSFKKQGQKIISVFGCGGNRDRTKRPKMAEVAERYSDFVIVTTDNSRTENEGEIISDILAGFKHPEKRKVISSRTSAINSAILLADDGDAVIIIGKGHEKYNIDKYGYHDFDERQIIAAAIEKRKTEGAK